jgi:hypothetical protein
MDGDMRVLERLIECQAGSFLGFGVPRAMLYAMNGVEEEQVLSPLNPIRVKFLT